MSVDWDRAACRDSLLDWTDLKAANVAACLQLCGRCPIRTECRDHADRTDERLLILGGETPNARRARQQLERKREANAT